MKYGKLWLSVPDPNDGLCMELLEPLTPKSKKDVQVACEWFGSEADARAWATANGAQRIEVV